MSALTFTLIHRPQQGVDLSTLTPDQLQGKKLADIKNLELGSGPQKHKVRELFDVTGSDTSHIIIHRSCDKLHHIGAGMTQGSIEVGGAVGDYLGKKMQGGTIKVRGNAGQWTGGGMRGGFIEIFGNTGDYLGAVLQGEQEGMADGTILVTCNAGDRVGDRMRRGTIVIKGAAGAYCGGRMLAGTIVVLGDTGKFIGLAMKRGTIVLGTKPEQVPVTFNSCGQLKMEFLRVIFKHLSKSHRPLLMLKDVGPEAERYAGDLATGGKGELLILQTVL